MAISIIRDVAISHSGTSVEINRDGTENGDVKGIREATLAAILSGTAKLLFYCPTPTLIRAVIP